MGRQFASRFANKMNIFIYVGSEIIVRDEGFTAAVARIFLRAQPDHVLISRGLDFGRIIF